MELWENNSLRQMKGKITNSKQQLHKKKNQTHRQINKNKQKQQQHTRQTKTLPAKCKVLLLFYEHSPSIVLL